MGNFNEFCHYEMAAKALKLYKEQHPNLTKERQLDHQIMADFEGNGWISVWIMGSEYPDNHEHEYAFKCLSKIS